DAGMTGPFDSVIGVEKEIIIKKFITGIPAKFDISKKDVRFNGVLVKIDSKTGRAGSIERISIKHE
ncbi:MAG TPA: metallophosphoesterase, partial [bacterium]|nr:metallophosphoesterase [bacterium]